MNMFFPAVFWQPFIFSLFKTNKGKMNYTAEFKEYIDICKKQNQFIGFGNPNAPILIICNDIKTGLLSINENWYYKNSEYWESNIKNNKTLSQLGYDFIPSDDSPLNNNKHNWRKYQIFHNLIFNAASRIKDTDCQYPRKPSYKKYIPNRIDFLERIFIIEFKNMKVMDVILNTTFVKSFKINLLDDIDIKLREFKKTFSIFYEREANLYNSFVGPVEPGSFVTLEDGLFMDVNHNDIYFVQNLFNKITTRKLDKVIHEINYTLWEYGLPIIGNKRPTPKFIRTNGYQLLSGKCIPATTKLDMNFEGLAKYENEIVDVLAIPDKYFEKPIKSQQNIPKNIPLDFIMEIYEDALKFYIINELKLAKCVDFFEVYNNIDVIDNTEISYGDLQNLKKIDNNCIQIKGQRFNDLSILQYCHNLEHFSYTTDMSSELIIEPLKELKNIKTCNIDSCSLKFSDLDFIENWHNLEKLSINRPVDIKDISALKHTPKLKRLKMNVHEHCELIPISNLKKLEYLELNDEVLNRVDVLKKISNLDK